MGVSELFLRILSVLFCGAWIYALVYMLRSIRRIPVLRDVTSGTHLDDGPWPALSIIIPACNEAKHLEAALKSLLKQDYPALEVIVVNDRSTDSTGEIIDRMAATDARIQVVHIETLPDGWLGKVHAMHRGVQLAAGHWYLFTDADVYFEPDMLKCAVGYAHRHKLTHLTCVPEVNLPGAFWLDVVIRSFFLMFSVATRLTSVNREASKWAVGIGAFNFVEAAVFNRTPGFEWLRMEPADDLGLGLMVKQAGARTALVHGAGMLKVPWYTSVKEMFQGLEKNSFGPGANYRYSQQLFIVVLLWLLALAPAFSVVLGFLMPDPILFASGGLAVVSTLVVACVMPRDSARQILSYVLLPVGVLVMSAIMLRAAFLCFRNDGIDWRGTHYSVEKLRAGQRVRF
jgi:hypothetical protein